MEFDFLTWDDWFNSFLDSYEQMDIDYFLSKISNITASDLFDDFRSTVDFAAVSENVKELELSDQRFLEFWQDLRDCFVSRISHFLDRCPDCFYSDELQDLLVGLKEFQPIP